jgi:predicted nucleotidyltransferase component of viral defense system
MTLDVSIHKTILFQVLKEIYSDASIAPLLGFKGGTAALMFYGLDRFSVDLDFDLLDTSKSDYVFKRVAELLKKYGALKEEIIKHFSLFYVLSYEEQAHNIKVEINNRQFDSRYEIKTYLGVSMLVMTKEDMFSHKLVAMYERMHKTSRDIYDIWFFLQNRFSFNKEIIEKRSKMPLENLLKKCIKKLELMNNNSILTGLGELLNNSQKTWVKAKLKEDTIALLKLKLETI